MWILSRVEKITKKDPEKPRIVVPIPARRCSYISFKNFASRKIKNIEKIIEITPTRTWRLGSEELETKSKSTKLALAPKVSPTRKEKPKEAPDNAEKITI